MSAPRMVLQQYIDKWFPDDPADLPRMSDRAIKKLLLDVSVFSCVVFWGGGSEAVAGCESVGLWGGGRAGLLYHVRVSCVWRAAGLLLC